MKPVSISLSLYARQVIHTSPFPLLLLYREIGIVHALYTKDTDLEYRISNWAIVRNIYNQ